MKLSIKCCDSFYKIKDNFNWMHFRDNATGGVTFVMPTLQGDGNLCRVNYCPVCGKEVRSIKMVNDD